MTLPVLRLYSTVDRMIDWSDVVDGMKIGRGRRDTRGQLVAVTVCPPQLLHVLTWDWSWPAALGSRKLTSWAMARPRIRVVQIIHLVQEMYLLVIYVFYGVWIKSVHPLARGFGWFKSNWPPRMCTKEKRIKWFESARIYSQYRSSACVGTTGNVNARLNCLLFHTKLKRTSESVYSVMLY
jgi:hypothetical protein